MQTLEALKRKINTAEELHSVVKTMKALAAVNIRQYEKAVQSLDEYNRAVELGFQILLRQRPEVLALAQPRPTNRLGAIIFGSDQGMCGQLNDQIVAHALRSLTDQKIAPENQVLLAIGLRVAERLEAAGRRLDKQLSVPASTSGIIDRVQEILVILEAWHTRQQVDRVLLFFCKHLSGASFMPYTLYLLPVDDQWLQTFAGKKWPTRVLPTFTMDWQRLFSWLIRQYLFVSLYRAFAESLASENASRLASMQNAERNIEERLEALKAQFHRQRQMSITEELLDIISGFVALTDKKEGRRTQFAHGSRGRGSPPVII